MTTQTLKLRFTSSPIHAPKAWFLPGDSAPDWFAEIASWHIPHSAVRLLIIPQSPQNLNPLGVLVLVEGEPAIGPTKRCHRYGQLAGQLYLPVEARLEPAVHESELGRLLVGGRRYVWHPTAGLIGFDAEDVLKLNDLLAASPPANGQWGLADAGITFPRRLISLEAVQPISVQAIFEQGQEDIGTQADALDELPPSPEEKNQPGTFKKSLTNPFNPLAKFIQWATSKTPATANQETWIDRMRNWANRVLSPEHQSARERELARLMNMLKDDPDQGLKYAIPMGGEAGRGIAPPSTTLSSHEVDFRFHASRGGPMDRWYIPDNTLQQLRARYRELAEREIRLGRHRRAAYIYAELLGEMEQAAAALKSGGYYREAAIVYEERLKRPQTAAECLEEGGLWDEALERYEKLALFEKCGAIYRRLDRHDDAETAYRKAADICSDKGNLLHAAKLYEQECRDAETALNTLRRGWPSNSQAQNCLRAEFRLLARDGRHADSEKRVQELIGPTLDAQHILPLSEVLSETAGNYPEDTLRAKAADATRVIVSRKLITPHNKTATPEDRRLLKTIEQLAPEDRLLHRDCERFLRERETQRPPETYRLRQPGTKPEVIDRVQLPSHIQWQTAKASNRYFYAAGFSKNELVLVRGSWDSPNAVLEQVEWTYPVWGDAHVLLAPSPNETQDVWVHVVEKAPLPARMFPGNKQQWASTPPWTTRSTHALAQTANGVSWTISGREMLLLSVFSADHVPIVTRALSNFAYDEHFMEAGKVTIHARSEGLVLAWRTQLVFLDGNHRDIEIRLANPIIGLSGSAPHSRVRVAASFEDGGMVVWKDTQRMQHFGHGLTSPQTAFTVTGKLIAVDQSRIEVYNTSRNDLVFESSMPSPGKPVSVMPVERNGFAVLCTDGRLIHYRIAE